MPIDLSNYPPSWTEISWQVRFYRAQGRCECIGECMSRRHLEFVQQQRKLHTFMTRCPAIHGLISPYADRALTAPPVVLTTAHLDQDPSSDDTDRMRAMCPNCHLGYDRRLDQRALRAQVKLLASGHGRDIGEAGAGPDEREDPGEHA